ncbi:MAG: hypothetical protein ACTHYR_05575 [Brachybacterium sp.]
MSDLEDGITEHLRQQELRAQHRDSGLRDEVLLERYVARQDLVAFLDETHRASPQGDAGYYGLSAVIFHADELPEIRRGLEYIAGSKFWHSKEAAKDQLLRGRIGDMNEYIAQRAAMPAIVFDVRDQEITPSQERSARDLCLDRALRVLDREGIHDVVLDQFHHSEQHNVELDQALLTNLRATDQVDDRMWMHHGRMGEEHALWSADTVAWSVQRHYFGVKDWDSQHVAPLRGTLREIHAETGTPRRLDVDSRAKLSAPSGRRARVAPIHRLAKQIEILRNGRNPPGPASGPTRGNGPDTPKNPPTRGPEGPSRSL